MKKICGDIKTSITILFSATLVALLFISIFKNQYIFKTIFLLFTNLSTAVFTYIFTKKSENKKSE